MSQATSSGHPGTCQLRQGLVTLVLVVGSLIGCGSAGQSPASAEPPAAVPSPAPATLSSPMAVPAETSPTSSPQAAPTVAPIRIGLLAPLQGTNATLGGAAREAARRVVNRANVLARDSTRQYELIVEDNSGSAAVSQGLARKLIQRDGVVAAMLGLGSPIPSAPAQVFQAAGVPVVGWYCMRDLLNFPGPSDFVVVHQESFEVFCPERPSAGGAAIFADESTTWLLRAISAADSDDPREVRDALRRVPYR